jgi:hypothetical protein
MKNIIYLILILHINHANAEWVFYGKSSTGAEYSYDPSTIKRKGNLVKLWGLTNYFQEEQNEIVNKNFISEINLLNFNCNDESFMSSSLNQYSKLNGSGEVIYSNTRKVDHSDFLPIPPNSVGSKLLLIVCKRNPH